MSPTTRSTEITGDRVQQLEELLQQALDAQNQVALENTQLKDKVAQLTSLPSGDDMQDTQASEHSQHSSTPTPVEEQADHGTTDHRNTARLTSLAPTTLTATTGARFTEPKVASPEYFSGQRSKLTSFLTQITMVLVLQASRYPTELSKVLYTGSYLRDTALLWFQPFVTANPQPSFMRSFDLFKAELHKAFGDPDEEATAERQLYAVRQRGSATTYLAEFQRLAVLVKWNDEAKAAHFYRGLHDNIKDELSRTGKPKDLKALQEAAIRIDTRLFERRIERGDRIPAPSGPPPRSGSGIKPFNKPAGNPQPERLRAIGTISPDKLTRRGKLTPTEYQRRKDNNLCLYCGEKGHQVLKCPSAPQPGSKKTLYTSAVTQTQAQPEFLGKV